MVADKNIHCNSSVFLTRRLCSVVRRKCLPDRRFAFLIWEDSTLCSTSIAYFQVRVVYTIRKSKDGRTTKYLSDTGSIR